MAPWVIQRAWAWGSIAVALNPINPLGARLSHFTMPARMQLKDASTKQDFVSEFCTTHI